MQPNGVIRYGLSVLSAMAANKLYSIRPEIGINISDHLKYPIESGTHILAGIAGGLVVHSLMKDFGMYYSKSLEQIYSKKTSVIVTGSILSTYEFSRWKNPTIEETLIDIAANFAGAAIGVLLEERLEKLPEKQNPQQNP